MRVVVQTVDVVMPSGQHAQPRVPNKHFNVPSYLEGQGTLHFAYNPYFL